MHSLLTALLVVSPTQKREWCSKLHPNIVVGRRNLIFVTFSVMISKLKASLNPKALATFSHFAGIPTSLARTHRVCLLDRQFTESLLFGQVKISIT